MSSQPKKRSTNSKQSLQHQATKSPNNSQSYLCSRQLQSPHNPSRQGKTPLLPMPPAPTRETVTPRPPPYYNMQHHYQQCIPGPFRAANNNQCPPLLPFPSYHHPMPGNQVQALTRPHPHAQGHLIPQVSTYLSILLPYPSPFVNILQYTHAA